MKVLMLRNAARNLGCELAEGESGFVEKDLGDHLVSLGIATELEDQKTPRRVRGVAATPSIGETKKPEITASDSLDL